MYPTRIILQGTKSKRVYERCSLVAYFRQHEDPVAPLQIQEFMLFLNAWKIIPFWTHRGNCFTCFPKSSISTSHMLCPPFFNNSLLVSSEYGEVVGHFFGFSIHLACSASISHIFSASLRIADGHWRVLKKSLSGSKETAASMRDLPPRPTPDRMETPSPIWKSKRLEAAPKMEIYLWWIWLTKRHWRRAWKLCEIIFFLVFSKLYCERPWWPYAKP